MYYLLTKEQYDLIADSLSHLPAWSLDGSKCIAHNDNNINIDQYIKNDIEYLNNNYTNFEIDLRYKFFYNMII